MIDLSHMTTEQANQNTENFSSLSIRDAVEIMHREDYQAVSCIEPQMDQIARVIEVTSEVLENGGRIIYVGAGTSGRLGVLDAVECPPTFGVDYNTVVGLIAGGEKAFIKAAEGAEDSAAQASIDLQEISLTDQDVVIGIAASGRTPYVIGAIEYAQSIGAKACGLVCNIDSPIKKICPLTIEVSPGPEVLTGSTRLKAGTATKLILNMISTISMVRIGKIYKNYMVDLKMSNEKLQTRGVGIVQSVTGCDKRTAEEALAASEQQVKIAIVMILMDVDKEEAEKALQKANHRIQDIDALAHETNT